MRHYDDPMSEPLAYLAGPLFDDGERWFMEQLEAVVADAGYRTFLPHRDNVTKTTETVGDIFDTNIDAIDQAALLVVNLNGVTTDDGTAWEVGYAYARGIRAIGVYTDWRSRFKDETVNLMLERSLDQLVHSLEELAGVLAPTAT